MRSIAFALLVLLFVGCGGDAPPPGFVSIEKSAEYQNPALLARAWQLPVAAQYKPGFASQENGSLCGMASTANVLRSLGQPAPAQKSLILGSVSPLLGVELMGITLDELSGLVRAKLPKRQVTVLRDLSLGQLRAEAAHFNDSGTRYIVNITRKPLFGRGHGHFSPIGGYLADADLVFVLDTNAEYKPFLVKTDRLFAAIDTVDSSSDKKRGLLRIQ
ncbi:MAG TPA: phytochelatin synthase family protein [Polyangiales bacterium]|jgi:hypothetical protein|nr:phytochelatin synthase family protein [Polyangiales bacterium]